MLSKYYQVLGLTEGANDKRIKSAYRRLAFKYHPDRSKSNETQQRFIEIYQAYEYLMSHPVAEKNTEVPTSSPSSKDVIIEDPYQSFMDVWERDKEGTLRKARKKYSDFLKRNSDYKIHWYYLPLRIIAYVIYLFMLVIGVVLMVGPIIGIIYGAYKTLIIAFVPLLLAGVVILKSAVYYKLRIDPYFDHSV